MPKATKIIAPVVFIIVFLLALLSPYFVKRLPTKPDKKLITIRYDFGSGSTSKVFKDKVFYPGVYEFSELKLTGKITLQARKEPKGLVLKATKKIFVDTNASIDVSAKGYLSKANESQGQGLGAGISFEYAGGGASHGGLGGAGDISSSAANPADYGYYDVDESFGSSGARGQKGTGVGGAGGGYIMLEAPEIIIKGKILANGKDGKQTGGGGAGGKIVLIAKKLVLDGAISANGGTGATSQIQGAGGGGGGVICLPKKYSGSKEVSVAGGKGGQAIDIYTGGFGQDGSLGKIVYISDN
ncbi:MAG: hypothetical protein C4562_03740 [Actinobacteria bacterium]|nr:MAG: hypothetical protein C4562_03740 [Actinomycetota bacterium]